jgi:hypothetical protein
VLSNRGRGTALHEAVAGKHEDAVELLLNYRCGAAAACLRVLPRHSAMDGCRPSTHMKLGWRRGGVGLLGCHASILKLLPRMPTPPKGRPIPRECQG